MEWLLVCVITQSSHQHTATQFNRYKGSIYLVFDFCEHDLAGLLSNANVKFTLAEIKKVMQMLLNGLYYIHRNKVRLRSIYDRLPSHRHCNLEWEKLMIIDSTVGFGSKL